MDWKLFLSTFALIFVAELPDKTAFATLLMAAKHGAFPVFLGASLAFVIQCAVAVAFGSVISLLPPVWVHALAGALFLVFAVMMWREKEEEEGKEIAEREEKYSHANFWKIVLSAFTVIFIAEWGDLTQLATATLQAKYHQPVTIFLSSTAALWAVTGLVAALGQGARKMIRPQPLQRIAAVIFAGVGVVFLAKL